MALAAGNLRFIRRSEGGCNNELYVCRLQQASLECV